MREIHLHTIQHCLGDIPAYAAILWVKFSGIINQIYMPDWERFIFEHGWLVLLFLRVWNVVYDIHLKRKYEGEQKKSAESEKSWWQLIFDFFRKFFLK